MDNYNYPMGADTPDAPWNQVEPEEKEVEICVSITLSKSSSVTTNSYNIEYDDCCDKECCGRSTTYDFSGNDFNSLYNDQHYTVPELLKELISRVQEEINDNEKVINNLDPNFSITKKELIRRNNQLKNMITDASDWVEDDMEVCEDE